ncbi:MAG: hypothetical protein HY698_06585 [Deltaproteobacteria bacterium]|nr:hypothetical protein [Deltaproteobacteria bacterium]
MIQEIRSVVFRAIRSPKGEGVPPIRWAKDFLLFVNDMTGKPLSPSEPSDLMTKRNPSYTRLPPH